MSPALFPDMRSKRRKANENRARLTLRREVLRNLSADDLSQAQGGGDPLTALVNNLLRLERGKGACRYSE